MHYIILPYYLSALPLTLLKRVQTSLFTLQIGQDMNPKVILGPSQRFSRTLLVHWRWNTWLQSSWKQARADNYTLISCMDACTVCMHELFCCTWIAGAADRASVKQIMHISSASCFREASVLKQPCRQGRHSSSFLTPPHGWPHGWVLLQASFAYSYTRYDCKITQFQ